MSFLEQEANDTILHGWRNDKSIEETSDELVQLYAYVSNVMKLYNKKRRASKTSKRKRQNSRGVEHK